MLSITVDEFLKLQNPNTIDIRSVQSYNNNHITNAKNIPLEKLFGNPNMYLNKQDIYYIYCQKGVSSLKACHILNKLGYKVLSIDGGYEAWILKK